MVVKRKTWMATSLTATTKSYTQSTSAKPVTLQTTRCIESWFDHYRPESG